MRQRLRDVHEQLDGVRMRAPFFAFSGYFMAFAAAAFVILVLGLFLDKAVAMPAFWLVAACGGCMLLDAVRVTWQEFRD